FDQGHLFGSEAESLPALLGGLLELTELRDMTTDVELTSLLRLGLRSGLGGFLLSDLLGHSLGIDRRTHAGLLIDRYGFGRDHILLGRNKLAVLDRGDLHTFTIGAGDANLFDLADVIACNSLTEQDLSFALTRHGPIGSKVSVVLCGDLS